MSKDTRSPAAARVSRPYQLYPKAIIRLPVAKRNPFPSVSAVPCTRYCDAAISNSTINARIQYGNSVHVGDWLQVAQIRYTIDNGLSKNSEAQEMPRPLRICMINI